MSSKDEYKSVEAIKPVIETQASKQKISQNGQRPGWFKRKYLLIKKAIGEQWVVGRYGFQLGGIAGMILGSIFGGYEAYRMKSIWPIPIAMLTSGITFGGIFAISSILRSKEDVDNQIEFEVIYYDSIKRKWISNSSPINEKVSNKKI